MKLASYLLLVLALSAAAVQAQTPSKLTTLFASNNNGSDGGMVYFDIDVKKPLRLIGIESNLDDPANTPVSIQVYRCRNSYVGNESNASAWNLVARDDGNSLSAGQDQPTLFKLRNPLTLAPGQFGLAIEVTGLGHRYTNGNGSNQNYADANISLTLGAASNTPFGATVFNPRVWNGSLIYTDAVQAAASSFGTGSSTARARSNPLPIGPFARTFSADLSRGFYFQAPVAMKIEGLRVPNEAKQPQQAIALFTLPSAPPAFSPGPPIGLKELLFFQEGAAAGQILKPTLPIEIQAGSWVGVFGAGQAPGSSTMYSSYGAANVPSNVLGKSVVLRRLIYQGSMAGLKTFKGPVSSEDRSPIGRVELFVTGQPNPVPSLITNGLPVLGKTPEFELDGGIPGLQFGFINVSLKRLPGSTGLPTPFGRLLIVPSFLFQFPIPGGTGKFPLPLPNDSNFAGLEFHSQALVLDLTNNVFGMSNGESWRLGY
jgi:hypothetical protein